MNNYACVISRLLLQISYRDMHDGLTSDAISLGLLCHLSVADKMTDDLAVHSTMSVTCVPHLFNRRNNFPQDFDII